MCCAHYCKQQVHAQRLEKLLFSYYATILPHQATWVAKLRVKNSRNYRNDQEDNIDKTEQSHVIED